MDAERACAHKALELLSPVTAHTIYVCVCILCRERGEDRRPRNRYDLTIFASAPAALLFDEDVGVASRTDVPSVRWRCPVHTVRDPCVRFCEVRVHVYDFCKKA